MLDSDFTQEIAALRSTFDDIRAVVDVDALEADIARLSEQAGAPRPVGRPPPQRRRSRARSVTSRPISSA